MLREPETVETKSAEFEKSKQLADRSLAFYFCSSDGINLLQPSSKIADLSGYC